MYNNTSYEEYMRTVLGYTPNYMQDIYNNDYYRTQTEFFNDINMQELYPDIYIKVYPLVCNECVANNMPITKEILEQMTDNVYNKIEIDLKIHTNPETRNDVKNQTVKQEDRNVRQNAFLRDLIKILILNQLLGGGGRPPHMGPRPPFPGPRPPFPGPGPIRPREV